MQRNRTSYILFRKTPFFYGLFFILLALLWSNCGVKKKLTYEEFLVEQNDVVFTEKDLQDEKKTNLEYELLTLAKPKPNSKFFVFFRMGIWAYYKTNQEQDTTSIDRFMRKRIAEKPSIYSDEKANASAEAMMNFLNKKGYFQANVKAEEAVYTKRKIAKVKYYVTLGKRYYVDTIQYHSVDTLLQPLIDELEKTSLLRQGKAVSENLYYKEINRITDTLRNNGYAYFYGNYIQNLESDSTNNGRNLNLDLYIQRPEKGLHHQIYTIGKIQVFPDYHTQDFEQETRDTLVNGVTFTIPKNKEFLLNPQVLLNQIFLEEGNLYRQKDYDKTNLLLGNLGIFKFINFILEENPNDANILDVKIYLTPNKRMSMGIETELNNSFRSSLNTTGRLFSLGGGVNLNFQNRNTFGGGELLNVLLEGGVEVNFNDDKVVRINSLDLTARTDLYFPKFIDYMGYWKLMNKVKFGKRSLLTDNFHRDLREKARSRVSLSYNYQDFINYYTFNTFNVTLGYNLTRNAKERIIFDQTGIDFFQSEIKDSFQIIVNNNTFLNRSLGDNQLFTGFLYRNLNYAWTSKTFTKGGVWQFRLTNEVSGAEVLLLNTLINRQRKPFNISNTSFAHYARLDADVRYHRSLLNNKVFAFRAYAGVASPFGGLTSVVPYVKQYYIGGPSSVRAWLVRQLGPGSFNDPSVTEPPYYQAGDVKMEFNAEYRFDLIPYFLLEGALFLDAGNIWTLREDPDRIGSQLSSNFINEFALGGGMGFRFDFSFFIIRLDMGYKLRTPYIDENGSQWQLYRFSDYRFVDFFRPSIVNYNLAIGYPF